MGDGFNREPMMDMFLFETNQLIEQLEQIVIQSEKTGTIDTDSINEIFRIMHTIKGSSAMMLFKNISTIAHAVEDLFYYLRESKPQNVDYSKLTDIVLESIDFIKTETAKVENGQECEREPGQQVGEIKFFLEALKSSNSSDTSVEKENQTQVPLKTSDQKYYITYDKNAISGEACIFKVSGFFEEGCEMENIRTFSIIHDLKEFGEVIYHTPEDVIDNDESIDVIRREGFAIIFNSRKNIQELYDFFKGIAFLKDLKLDKMDNENEVKVIEEKKKNAQKIPQPAVEEIKKEYESHSGGIHQSIISVNVSKLDKLMDLVGELVIAEAMVTQNPELQGLQLDNFYKAARQLRKITGELQDIVMSVRMVPLSMTFQKMNRIVRDTSKKLNKEVELKIIGEETEVDKNIIEHLSDPLMHLIRNAIDHGIESSEGRMAIGKESKGVIILEAKNAGGDVWVSVKDDGKGLDRDKIYNKALGNGLTDKAQEELTDKEIYSFILLPGFSTKENVTELSGRGVGMDVVLKNIEKVGGSVLIESKLGKGTTISMKIPLTLAIIDGMNLKVGNSRYTIPTTAIKESFRPKEKDIIIDPNGNEMIMIRGECYPITRLHEIYNVRTNITGLCEGIMVMIENNSKGLCIFADELLGQQQVVVKALPNYIKKVRGLAGCTLLGDGNISLIIDPDGLEELKGQ